MIIGLGHKARMGKDAVAEYLVEQYGFVHISFAGHLKRITQTAFGFTHNQVWGDKKLIVDEYWGNTPAHFLQQVGTDMFRKMDPDFWVKALFRKIDSSLISREKKIVISDVRFPNEAQAIQDRGGYVFKVVRPYHLLEDTGRSLTHLSETALDNWDMWDDTIHNGGSELSILHGSIDFMMRLLANGHYD